VGREPGSAGPDAYKAKGAMGPEFWVGLVAVFVCGGAIGTVGTLMAQWVLRKLTGPEAPPPRLPLSEREMDLLRSEVADLGHMVQNLDARLDFQEQLVGGGLPTTQPPPRLPEAERDVPADPRSETRAEPEA
jgi:hypothetical protein